MRLKTSALRYIQIVLNTDYKDYQMTLSQSEQQKQRRRSVLKAVAGAPVIFTLSAGTEVAAASLTCKDKSATLFNNTSPSLASTSADTWVRFKVQGKKIKIAASSGSTIVSDAFTLGGNWYRVATNGTVTNVTATFLQDKGPVTGLFYYLLVDHSKYLNSTITSPQSFVFLGTDQNVTAPVAGSSCWNSITPPPGNQVPTSNILN